MSVKGYGLASNALTPGKDFRAVKDSTGKWTASMTFTIRRGDYSGVASSLAKGSLASTIYPDIDPYFANMFIDNHEYAENQGGSGGGMDNITVNFVGFEEGDEGQTERETIYDQSTSLSEKPTIEHPKFLQVFVDYREPIVMLYNGSARWEKSSDGEIQIFSITNGNPIKTLYDEDALKWFNLIIRDGWRTYKVPESEYVETKTDLGGLSDSALEKMGKIDTPPKNPATPPEKIWMLSGATETRSSENPITWTRTWSTIDDNDNNKLLYDY